MLEHRQKITSYSGLCRHNRKRDLFKSSVSALTIGGTMKAFTVLMEKRNHLLKSYSQFSGKLSLLQ